MDSLFLKLFEIILQKIFIIDSDHGHDLATRRYLTGLLSYDSSTPSTWMSKRQGSIASSTYVAEFSALRTATEEAQSLRYILRYLGCNVPSDWLWPTRIFGDNPSVILNAQNPAADLSKKYVAVYFHIVREAVLAGSIESYWVKRAFNTSGIMTKQIPRTNFK